MPGCRGPEVPARFWCEVLDLVVLDREDDGSVEIGPREGFGGPQPTIWSGLGTRRPGSAPKPGHVPVPGRPSTGSGASCAVTEVGTAARNLVRSDRTGVCHERVGRMPSRVAR